MKKIRHWLSVLLSVAILLGMSSCLLETPHRHTLVKIEASEATCMGDGNLEYWSCGECGKVFSDAVGQTEIELSATVLTGGTHKTEFVSRKEADAHKTGMEEHWSCMYCEKFFVDESATTEISVSDLTLPAPLEIDFIVEVEDGREPIILQLTDTQIIDAAQIRTADSLADWQKEKYPTSQAENLCYRYIREIVEATNPDLILLTGDLVFGQFDDNGTAFEGLVEVMDSLKVPWAPIFGNHEIESKKGVNWQCQQLKNAKYCLFKQRDLTGNGNYTVGIEQGGVLTRVFFMLDSNGSGAASLSSILNGHTVKTAGFGEDQIQWYTDLIGEIKELSPHTKLSFVFHIQLQAFIDAFEQYGFDGSQGRETEIYIDRLENRAETDFGHIGWTRATPWDKDYKIWNSLKAFGVDSVFVGHEHCNSASIVYEGIRLQFGQKSSEYDTYNYLATDGRIYSKSSAGAVPLIGGTVIPLSEDGTITTPYIYYCKDAGGSADWSQWE